MRKSTFWRAPRPIAGMAVVALHAVVIALLLMTRTMSLAPNSPDHSIELVYIPSAAPLPVRADSGRPLRLRTDIAISPPAPILGSAVPASIATGSGTHGAGIDWQAEAHRAIKAYEIRRDHSAESATSGKTLPGQWWPEQGPHAGDRYKNEAGDWIVWLDADCYKVASWHSKEPAADAAPADIVCPGKPKPAPSPPP